MVVRYDGFQGPLLRPKMVNLIQFLFSQTISDSEGAKVVF